MDPDPGKLKKKINLKTLIPILNDKKSIFDFDFDLDPYHLMRIQIQPFYLLRIRIQGNDTDPKDPNLRHWWA